MRTVGSGLRAGARVYRRGLLVGRAVVERGGEAGWRAAGRTRVGTEEPEHRVLCQARARRARSRARRSLRVRRVRGVRRGQHERGRGAEPRERRARDRTRRLHRQASALRQLCLPLVALIQLQRQEVVLYAQLADLCRLVEDVARKLQATHSAI